MVLSQTKVNYFNQGNAKLLTGMSHLIYWIAMHSLQKYDPNHLLKVLFSNPCSVEKTKKLRLTEVVYPKFGCFWASFPASSTMPRICHTFKVSTPLPPNPYEVWPQGVYDRPMTVCRISFLATYQFEEWSVVWSAGERKLFEIHWERCSPE